MIRGPKSKKINTFKISDQIDDIRNSLDLENVNLTIGCQSGSGSRYSHYNKYQTTVPVSKIKEDTKLLLTLSYLKTRVSAMNSKIPQWVPGYIETELGIKLPEERIKNLYIHGHLEYCGKSLDLPSFYSSGHLKSSYRQDVWLKEQENILKQLENL